MAIERTIKCDICGATATEENKDGGFKGWTGIMGIALDGVPNPSFCPSCSKDILNFVDQYKQRKTGRIQLVN